jgi:hypothetical protein
MDRKQPQVIISLVVGLELGISCNQLDAAGDDLEDECFTCLCGMLRAGNCQFNAWIFDAV